MHGPAFSWLEFREWKQNSPLLRFLRRQRPEVKLASRVRHFCDKALL